MHNRKLFLSKGSRCMSFFWFLIAIIFLALWLNVRSAQKKTDQEAFDSGYRRGKDDLATIIRSELAKSASGHAGIKKIIDGESPSMNPTVQPSKPVEVDTIAGIDFSSAPETVPIAVTPDEYVQEPIAPARTKKQDVERNLNVLLYTASFLIIAAAAAFIATGLPPGARLTGLWFVIIAFYSAGMILHYKVPYLRPAATAFIGTGLAMVPFAGIALSQLGGLSGGWSWFITSVVGIISYAVAALRLKSDVVSYLTIAFALSLAASTVATFSGPIVLYFVALIFASLIFHLLAHFDAKWVPELFKLPISQTSQLLTPATLIGSLFAYDSMTLVSYQLVFWVATLYYVVLWFTERGIVYETIVRALASISLFVSVLYVYDSNLAATLTYILIIAAIQSAYSLLRVRFASQRSRTVEISWLSVVVSILIVTVLLWTATGVAQLGVLLQTSLVTAISLASAYRFRNVYMAIPALIASAVLPFIIGRWRGNELWDVQTITWLFIIAASVTLVASYFSRQRSSAVRGFLKSTFWLYAVIAFFTSFGQGSTVAFILSTVGLAAVFMTASYVYRQWAIEVVSLVLIVPIVGLTLSEADVMSEWSNVLIVGYSAAIYALILLAHHLTSQFMRRDIATIAAVVVGGGLVFNMGAPQQVLQVVFFIALFYIVLGLTLRRLATTGVLRGLFSVTYAVYPLIMLLFAANLGLGWLFAALAITSATYWLGSYIEKSPRVIAFGNAAFIATIAALWVWLKFDGEWFAFGVAWTAAAVLYIAALIHTITDTDSKRRTIHLLFVWTLLGLVTLFNIAMDGSYGYAAAGTLLAITGTIVVEGILKSRKDIIEAGIYVGTFALQRIVGLSSPDLNMAFYAHWWAIVIFATAVWIKGESFKTRLILAVAFITGSTGIMALQEGGTYQVLFLFEHIALLVAGVLLRAQWALWWGLSATILAVLYFLRESLFLALLFLGLTLLGIVIWRLIRNNKK